MTKEKKKKSDARVRESVRHVCEYISADLLLTSHTDSDYDDGDYDLYHMLTSTQGDWPRNK